MYSRMTKRSWSTWSGSRSKTLKEAINEAMRDWVTNVRTTHYILGSALGCPPIPGMVRDFHRIISEETKSNFLKKKEDYSDEMIACVGEEATQSGSLTFSKKPKFMLGGCGS